MINSKTEIYLLLYIVKNGMYLFILYRKRNYFSLGDNLLEACLSSIYVHFIMIIANVASKVINFKILK